VARATGKKDAERGNGKVALGIQSKKSELQARNQMEAKKRSINNPIPIINMNNHFWAFLRPPPRPPPRPAPARPPLPEPRSPKPLALSPRASGPLTLSSRLRSSLL
jgi:hypothetical protein